MSLGLMVTVLSLMALPAAGAQADGEWTINEESLAEHGKSEATINGSANEAFRLGIPWYASEISCTTLETKNSKISTGGGGHLTIDLSDCAVSGPPFVDKTCKVIEPLELNVKVLLIYHNPNGRTYDLFQPVETGKPLATVQFKEGTECPLPLSNKVAGGFVGESTAGENTERLLTLNPTIEALFGDTLEFGVHPATLKGGAVLALSGEFKGAGWKGSVPQAPKEWKIKGQTLSALKTEEASITGSGSNTFVIKETSFAEVEISCAEMDVANGLILKGGGSSATFMLQQCQLAPKTGCKVIEPISFDVTGRLVSNEEKTFILFEPAEGEYLITVKLETKIGHCLLGNELGYQGTIVAEMEAGERAEQPLMFNSSIDFLFPGDGLTIGESTASVEGEATLELSSPYEGSVWTGIG